jgi:hypothetical protein
MHGPEAVLMQSAAHHGARNYASTRLSQPANGARSRVGRWGIRDDGAVQATGFGWGTATRTINSDFSHSFLRHSTF